MNRVAIPSRPASTKSARGYQFRASADRDGVLFHPHMWSGLNANLHGGEQRGVLAADHARREGSPDQRFRSADAQRRMDM